MPRLPQEIAGLIKGLLTVGFPQGRLLGPAISWGVFTWPFLGPSDCHDFGKSSGADFVTGDTQKNYVLERIPHPRQKCRDGLSQFQYRTVAAMVEKNVSPFKIFQVFVIFGILTQPMAEKKSLNFIFPTKYVIPKSLKFSHWPSKYLC